MELYTERQRKLNAAYDSLLSLEAEPGTLGYKVLKEDYFDRSKIQELFKIQEKNLK